MFLLWLGICNGSPFLLSERQRSWQTPIRPVSTQIPPLPRPHLLPFHHSPPLLSLSQPWRPSCYYWLRYTSVQALCTSLGLLSFSPKILAWFTLLLPSDLSSNVIFFQWGLPWPLSFKLQVSPNPSLLYLLSSIYHHLTYYIFYLCMCFSQPSPLPHGSSMSTQIFKSLAHHSTPPT